MQSRQFHSIQSGNYSSSNQVQGKNTEKADLGAELGVAGRPRLSL